MLPSESDCDDCVPSHVAGAPPSSIALSTLPFVSTFLLVAVIVHRKVYPLLASSSNDSTPRSANQPPASTSYDVFSIASLWRKPTSRKVGSVAFSSTIALSAVLAELLLCEISNSFHPATRKIAIRATVASLLCLLVVVIPLLEIYCIVKAAGWKFVAGTRASAQFAWSLQVVGYVVFLAGFWSIGAFLPTPDGDAGPGLMNPVSACLERLGITGTLMMGLLSGFAAVSAIWQSFAAKTRPIMEADINRKQAGLEATSELLASKRNRLKQLETKVALSPNSGFFQQALGSLRGSADLQELKTLELEISGLTTMSVSLEDSISILRSHRSSQLGASTTRGRLVAACSYLFSCYCVYRIASTSINLARKARRSGRSSSLTSTDPITHLITLFARHIYPSLNQAAWTRQISFLLSGLILLASFNAVLQTFHLVSRIFPSALRAFKSNKALLIAQTAGLYMISSALMLRNVMPKDVGSVINDALGTGVLHPAWTELWFEAWFTGSVLFSGFGIWLSQKFKGSDGVWDDDGWDMDVETGQVGSKPRNPDIYMKKDLDIIEKRPRVAFEMKDDFILEISKQDATPKISDNLSKDLSKTYNLYSSRFGSSVPAQTPKTALPNSAIANDPPSPSTLMTDRTPDVSSLLVTSHSSAPIQRHGHSPDHLDTFLQEAYRINSHITSLILYLRQIRQPYLSTAAPPPSRIRAPTKTAGPPSATYLTDSQRAEIDTQTSRLLQDLSGNISSLTAAENLRSSTKSALLERRYGKNGGNSSALWRWAAGGNTDEGEDELLRKSTEQLNGEGEAHAMKVTRESVLWYLGTRLQEAVEVQRGMVEVRAAREREKEKSVLWKMETNSQLSGGQIPRRTADGVESPASPGKNMVNGLSNHKPDVGSYNPTFAEKQSDGQVDELPPEMRQLFESENSALLQHHESSLSKVQAAERSLLEIASLQQTLVGHLSTQGEVVEQLVQDAVGTGENVQKGNRELKRARERWGRGLARGVFWGTVGLCSFCVMWDLIF